MVTEYLERYKHHPAAVPGMTWHEFAYHVDRRGEFQVRDRLVLADAVSLGQPAQSGSDLAFRAMERRRLERIAWPEREG